MRRANGGEQTSKKTKTKTKSKNPIVSDSYITFRKENFFTCLAKNVGLRGFERR